MIIHYCASHNFGDELSPYLAEVLSGDTVYYGDADAEGTKYLITGSILNWDVKDAIVWGAGLANLHDTVTVDDIRMVRGPIAAEIARKCGKTVPDVYGDPALLLPMFYTPPKEKKYKLGIFPHWSEIEMIENIKSDKFLLINAFNDVEKVIDDINSCEKVISSSLHGIIVSHAYGVPCDWVKFSDTIGGDDTKFNDYYASIGSDYLPINMINKIDIDWLVAYKTPVTDISKIDLNEMLNCCPFYEKQ